VSKRLGRVMRPGTGPTRFLNADEWIVLLLSVSALANADGRSVSLRVSTSRSSSPRVPEAEEMRMEHRDNAPTDCSRPEELRALLGNATGEMRAVIALQGLSGLRLAEALRLDWREVFTIAGHVEISTSKSKTRSRRLVEICPPLEQWLAPFRGSEGRVGARWATANDYVRDFAVLRNRLRIPSRKNGLRHGFSTCHFALHNNENLTAAQAGNSPAMIHGHYKGLATKIETEKWFNVRPSMARQQADWVAA
jgi:integrase